MKFNPLGEVNGKRVVVVDDSIVRGSTTRQIVAMLFEAGAQEVREEIGATSLAYLSLEGLQEATRRPADTFCRACLTREYPTRIPEDLRLTKLRFETSKA